MGRWQTQEWPGVGKPAGVGLMAERPSQQARLSVPNDPSDHFRLLLCCLASRSLWPPWLGRGPPGLAHPCLGPLSTGVQLSPAIPSTGFDPDVPISLDPFLQLPASCLWLPAADLPCRPRRGPLGLRPLCPAVDKVAGCGEPVGQGSGGQAVVALFLVQEEAKRVGLGHSELGGTELVQGGNRGPGGHSQGLGGTATVGVLVGYSEEALCRKTSEARVQSCLLRLWLHSLRSQGRLRRDGAQGINPGVEPSDESFLDKGSCGKVRSALALASGLELQARWPEGWPQQLSRA